MSVVMKCGCVAMATHNNRHGELAPGHPSCPVCECCEVAPSSPDLTNRKARCDYYLPGGTWRRARDYGPIFGGGEKAGICDNKTGCRCEVPSSTDLPFFTYLGEGSNNYKAKNGPQEFDSFFCGCRGWD